MEIANNELKKGMTKSQVESVMGMPDDIQEKSGNREDWIYIGNARSEFQNIRLIFSGNKYIKWQPAGKNVVGEASYDAAISDQFDGIRSINEQSQRNIDSINRNSQLNGINNSLNNRWNPY